MRVALAVVVAACTSEFTYTAGVGWGQDTPEIRTVTFDGSAITSPFFFTETYDSFAASQTPHVVEVTTDAGTMTFSVVPTPCGDACDYMIACDSLESESDDWEFSHDLGPTHVLELGAVEGRCSGDGQTKVWIAN